MHPSWPTHSTSRKAKAAQAREARRALNRDGRDDEGGRALDTLRRLTTAAIGRPRQRLEVDDEVNLYWDGEPVVTEARLSLNWWVNAAAIVTGLSTLALTVVEWLRFLSS